MPCLRGWRGVPRLGGGPARPRLRGSAFRQARLGHARPQPPPHQFSSRNPLRRMQGRHPAHLSAVPRPLPARASDGQRRRSFPLPPTGRRCTANAAPLCPRSVDESSRPCPKRNAEHGAVGRHPEYQSVSDAVFAAIRHAWPDARAKRIAAELGCSVVTGKRIASTGKVSGRFRAALLRVLDHAIAKNLEELERLQAELKAHDYMAMVDRAADRRTQGVDTAPATTAGRGEPAEQLPLIPPAGGRGR